MDATKEFDNQTYLCFWVNQFSGQQFVKEFFGMEEFYKIIGGKDNLEVEWESNCYIVGIIKNTDWHVDIIHFVKGTHIEHD